MAVNHAAFERQQNLFPASTKRLCAVMAEHGYNTADLPVDRATPQAIDNNAAAAVIASRSDLGGIDTCGCSAPGAYAGRIGRASCHGAWPDGLPSTPGLCVLSIADSYGWQPPTPGTEATQKLGLLHWERAHPFAPTSAAQTHRRARSAR